MGFIQPCFIQLQHNFDVLWIIDKLDALGYKPSIEQYGMKEGSESTYIICKSDGSYHYAYSISYFANDWGINCINHIGLFLALASLRDDTDFNQWFIFPKIVTKTICGYCGTTIGMDGNVRVIEGYDWIIRDANNTDWSDRINTELALCTDEKEKMFVPRKATVVDLYKRFMEF